MKQTIKNYLYNVIYQILTLLLPLVTVPYISRILGTEGIGIYSYTHSIAEYFVLVAMLGIQNYGNRIIAKAKDNQEKLNQTFSSLIIFHISLSIIVTIGYILYCIIIAKSNTKIAMIQLLYVTSAIFDITWFFNGMEEFKLTVTRNIIIRLISVALVFLFVKTSNDLVIYTAIIAGASLLSQISLWVVLKRYIKFKQVKAREVLSHFKPCLILFIPAIAASLYKIMDKIMLGNISNMSQVGIYENAEKIINVPLKIITALGTVMLPKMSNLVEKGEREKSKKYIEKSLTFVMFASSALCFGIMGIANKFIPIFLGEAFYESAKITFLLSITIIFISTTNVIRTQYLIPNEKDKSYMKSIALGAIVNLITNILLIPRFQATGATIGTILAEFSVMTYQIIDVRKEIQIIEYIKNGFKYIVLGFAMFVVVYIIGKFIENSILSLSIQIIVGAMLYLLIAGRIFCKDIGFSKEGCLEWKK
jgi:O-antigen/teichoic acid export membrane protein